MKIEFNGKLKKKKLERQREASRIAFKDYRFAERFIYELWGKIATKEDIKFIQENFDSYRKQHERFRT